MHSLSDIAGLRTLVAIGSCAFALLVGAPALSTQATAEVAPMEASWLTDWDKACEESRLAGRPMLVVTSLPACPWCRAFEGTLESEQVSTALQDMVLVRLDLTENALAAE